jgi:hypothetical protein
MGKRTRKEGRKHIRRKSEKNVCTSFNTVSSTAPRVPPVFGECWD